MSIDANKDLESLIVKDWELENILIRTGWSVSALADEIGMDRNTLRNKLQRIIVGVPVKLLDQLREKIGAEAFDAALSEIRDGTPAQDLFLNGTELAFLMKQMGWTNKECAHIIGRSKTFVGTTLRWQHQNSAIPLRYAVRLRDRIGHDRFAYLLAYIRREFGSRIPETVPTNTLRESFVGAAQSGQEGATT